ncbi:MAG: 23S rRNA (adenine1618-N6)-methyltransferase [Flavobacteriaceae bacterium]|uniref:23S rRNA (adenine(1618)-N(6))-methyltransferase RlmF n=1 Tax=Candidatus Marifrigoribacter sp. Uisw_064 TaxID=3230970 RepID=UPI003AEA7A35
MHPNNKHNDSYSFPELIKCNAELAPYAFENDYGVTTIDFSDNKAVLQLNKALLKLHYGVSEWNIPNNYLCPPIPGRVDYIHYIADLLASEGIDTAIKGLDIGVGANCIYPILASQLYDWKMVGVDSNETAVSSAKANIAVSEGLKKNIEIRHQENNANIFEGIIQKDEFFHFSMCNPPFHSSEENATKGTLRKMRNLQKNEGGYFKKEEIYLNFGGQANELWCNGGEALFIKRMIKQSAAFKDNIKWFTSLVSKKENLAKMYKQLNKLKVTHKTIEMTQGNKQSRIVAWSFNNPEVKV